LQAQIDSISTSVSLTSSVLTELDQILGRNETSICSENVVWTASSSMQERSEVLREMDAILRKRVPDLTRISTMREKSGGSQSGMAATVLERLGWPFLERKMEMEEYACADVEFHHVCVAGL